MKRKINSGSYCLRQLLQVPAPYLRLENFPVSRLFPIIHLRAYKREMATHYRDRYHHVSFFIGPKHVNVIKLSEKAFIEIAAK